MAETTGAPLERTLILIKPDAMQRGLAFEILQRFERPGLISYITACPIIAAVFEGTNAVAACRQTMGATKPVEAAPGTIRHDFGLEIGRNLVHGSANTDDAAREVEIWFRGQPVLDWKRDVDGWVFE
jgi:nucleoside-diphosphate kinase